MKRFRALAVVTAVLAATLAGCGGEDRTEAQETCVEALEEKYGEDGLKKVDDLTENSTELLTKVEGSLVYREQRGSGDRVDTWFTCQIDEAGAVTLHVKD